MPQSLAIEGSTDCPRPTEDNSRSALDLIHRLLIDSAAGQMTWEDRLHRLAEAFQAQGAGLAGVLEAIPVVQYHVSSARATPAAQRWPWETNPTLLVQLQGTASALPVQAADGRSFLISVPCLQDGARWLVWLEDHEERAWTEGEQSLLTLAALALARFVATAVGASAWASWIDRARIQQRLDDMAIVTARLSHDFGNILTGILGFTELGLAQIAPGTPGFARIQDVYQSAQRGVQFINRLNLFSQRSARQSRPAFLAAVVAEEATRLRAAWGAEVNLQVSVPADLPPVALDVGPLRQILAALLDNARHALARQGQICLEAARVEVTVHDCCELLGNPRPGTFVRLSIADNGSGFSSEAHRRVFVEPFFSTKPRHRGMGLITVYGLLRTCGGGLLLRSNRDGGTTAFVYLPVVEQEQAVIEASRPLAVPAVNRPRILLVEDDPITRRLLRLTLEPAGYVLDTANDGLEALERVKESGKGFDLYLIDVIMPRMNGLELARRLVEADVAANIVFMSGQVPVGFERESFGGKVFPLALKPFSSEELVRVVRSATAKAAPTASAGERTPGNATLGLSEAAPLAK